MKQKYQTAALSGSQQPFKQLSTGYLNDQSEIW
jgi:hypothetical protein